MVSTMSADHLSGLELLQHMLTNQVAPPPMAITMNMSLVHIEEGFARFEAIANETHLTPMGSVHGGYAATVLDSVLGCAVHSALKPGESYSTIDLNIKMFRPVPLATKLVAEGQLINRSRTLGVSNGKLMNEEGKIYAYASCTCKIISP